MVRAAIDPRAGNGSSGSSGGIVAGEQVTNDFAVTVTPASTVIARQIIVYGTLKVRCCIERCSQKKKTLLSRKVILFPKKAIVLYVRFGSRR